MKQKGFSLIEVLVAMTILSFITLIASQAFSFFVQKWDGRLGQFDTSFMDVRSALLVDATLQEIVPYVTLNNQGEAKMYFEGNRNGFVAVTQRSIQYPNYSAVIRVSIDEKSDQTFDLTYEEWPMLDRVLITSGNKLEFSAPIILFSGLTDINFEYYGVLKRDSNQNRGNIFEDSTFLTWQEEYSGFITNVHPEKIRLKLDFPNGELNTYIHLIQPTGGLTSIISTMGTKYEQLGY